MKPLLIPIALSLLLVPDDGRPKEKKPGKLPFELRLVPEMESFPDLAAGSPVPKDAAREHVAAARAAWQKAAPALQKRITPEVARALSRWAKKQMEKYKKVPPLKDGHRYRLVVGGSAHVNAGEGFAVYVNGKLLAQSSAGVGKRQGGQPRGGHIYADFRDEFKAGKVTIAATSFLRYNPPRHGVIPPRGHLTLWLEEQKIPPVRK